MSLVPNVHWFDNSMNANKLRQSYLKGFLDISGGAIQLRSDNSMNFYTGSGNGDTLALSIGPSKLTTKDAFGVTQDVDIYSLAALKGLSTNVQAYINAATNGTASGSFDQLKTVDQNITGNLVIQNTLVVGGNATFRQNVDVAGNLTAGNLHVMGDEYIEKALIVGGNCTIDGTLTVKGDVSMNKFHLAGSTISATSDVSFNNKLFVNLDTSMNGKLRVGSDASFGKNLEVAGQLKCTSLVIGNNTTGDSNAIVFANKFIVSNDTSLENKLYVGEDASLNGRLYVALDASMDSKLAVAKAVTLGDKLSTVGDVSFNGKLVLGDDATLNKKLSVASDAELNGKLLLAGDASLNGKLYVALNTTLGGKLSAVGDVSFSGKMSLGDDATLNGNLYSAKTITAPHMAATTDIVVGTGANALTLSQEGANAVISSANGNIYINPSVAGTNVGLVHIKNGLTVDGSINFTGEWIRTDTNVKFTTQIDVSNDGTGPALKVEQAGVNAVAQFTYGANTALKIVAGGNVAIGKTSANSTLDVAGNVNVDNNVTVTGDYSSAMGKITLTDGALTLTNGKLTTKTMEVTSDAAFDGKVSMYGAGNFDMTGTSGYFVQF